MGRPTELSLGLQQRRMPLVNSCYALSYHAICGRTTYDSSSGDHPESYVLPSARARARKPGGAGHGVIRVWSVPRIG